MAAGAGHRRKIAGEYGVCRKCQRGICVTCPSVWANPWKRSSLRPQCPAAGTWPGAWTPKPPSRGWAHHKRGVTESILPAVKHMAAPATRSCPKACRCPIPQEKGGLTPPTVVAGDKNRYIITDSFNRKRGEVLVRRGFGGDSASVKRHNGLEVGTATGEARGRGHAPQLVPG